MRAIFDLYIQAIYKYHSILGGAEFAASFGPGRYSVFTCVDFKGDGFDIKSPTEYGVWLSDFPVRFSTTLQQVYFGNETLLSSLKWSLA